MVKHRNISEYRERLDRTLASAALTNHDTLKSLVQNQLFRSSSDETETRSESVVEKRTHEVSNFLDMLRSTSLSVNEASKTTEASHGDWKLKEDNEEFRVMYRPGPLGTPFHTLLVEGYVDGPMDVCLCISWESALYRKWWPQYSFPPFKITSCECLKKVRIGEEITLVRVKVTWPLSAREALVHFFLFEYFQDDLIIGLFNTISDLSSIDKATHGFSKDGIPEAKDVVRIDLVGGFALQKVTSGRSYFRTVANMDMKLDFVPPSLINFISRQLIGSGFRLYQKLYCMPCGVDKILGGPKVPRSLLPEELGAHLTKTCAELRDMSVHTVASVSNYDEDYSKALEDPLYARVREALSSVSGPSNNIERKESKVDDRLLAQEYSIKNIQKTLVDGEQHVQMNSDSSEPLPENAAVTYKKDLLEIEEENGDESTELKDEIRNETVHSSGHVSGILEDENLAADRNSYGEIEEEESGDAGHFDDGGNGIGKPLANIIPQKSQVKCKRNGVISPEVEKALITLERAISVVRKYGYGGSTSPFPSLTKGGPAPAVEEGAQTDSSFLKDDRVTPNAEVSAEVPGKGGLVEGTSHESRDSSSNGDIRRGGSNSYMREVNHNKIAPASPEEQHLSIPAESSWIDVHSAKSGTAEVPTVVNAVHNSKQMGVEANETDESSIQQQEDKKLKRRRKYRLCCFSHSLI